MKTLITKKEYMAGEYTHDQYYGQFVTQELKYAVIRLVGAEKIKNSTCPHFNDISYKNGVWIWDRLDAKQYINTKKWALSGQGVISDGTFTEKLTGKFHWSKSQNTCIAKAAVKAVRREILDNESKK